MFIPGIQIRLWTVDEAMGAVAAVLVLLVYIFLQYDKRRKTRQGHISQQYSDLISELILCSNEAELKAVFNSGEYASLIAISQKSEMTRKVLCDELIKLHKSLTGIAAQNIVWVFNELQLHEDVFRRFKSPQWHIKAKAIQQLAEMQQRQHLTKIYKAINHPNYHVRMEAQLAIIKLTGFEGLRFLNVVRHPITPWQQLSIIQELSTETAVDAGKLSTWLLSKNETVAELALKLVRKYHCHELVAEVSQCAQSPAPWVRRQALQFLKEQEEINYKEAI